MMLKKPMSLCLGALLATFSLAQEEAPLEILHDWTPLFDGESLDGWSIKSGFATYRIEDGVIVGKTEEGSKNTFLVTDQMYGDFELEFETNVDEGLNSGVQIRSRLQEADHKGNQNEYGGRLAGPQVEVENGPGQGGFIYGEATGKGWLSPEPQVKDDKSVSEHDHYKNGDWNHYRVLAVGPRIRTWINDQPVADLTVDDEIFADYARGHLGLQVHGIKKGSGPFEARWRNIKIRTLVRREDRETADGKKQAYMFLDGIKVHETDPAKQPQPAVVTPPAYDAESAAAPEGAVVLFDGTEASLDNWVNDKWKLVNGALESVKGAGYQRSKQDFGSCQLHIEFATPTDVKGDGQGRGNSGVFLMGRYEIQVLDSYENTTYPDGQCGALYGRAKPLVNASRPPGEWQTYDITFHRPLFAEDGSVTRRAKFHVIHNGVVIHDNLELTGGTGWKGPHAASDYQKHGDVGKISMQDHGNPVRFRNIWVLPIED